MKGLASFLSILILTLGCGGQQEAEKGPRTVLRIGTDAAFPPFEAINPETEQPEGFDIELIAEICKSNGWTPEYIITPFDGLIPNLTTREYDAVISAMTITPRRAVVIDFSDPYFLTGQTVAVPLEDSTTTGIDDLPGKSVGVQLGTTGELMAKRMDGLHVYSYEDIGTAFVDMANGNLDAVLNDFPTIRAYIIRHGMVKTVGPILSTEYYGIAVRKGNNELLSQINKALGDIKRSGRYDEIHVKWFNAPSTLETISDSTGK